MKPSQKNVGDFLSESPGALGMLLFKLKRLQMMNECFLTHIDPKIRPYCQVGNWAQGCLIILAANGSIATHIRLASPLLLQKFKTEAPFKGIKTLQCKVNPYASNTTRLDEILFKLPKQLSISKEAAELVKEIAEDLPDEKLQQALLKIASHGE